MITKCRLSLGSVTYAEKAMRALAKAAVYSEIVKLDASKGHGCVYGLELSCSQLENAKTVLRSAGIKAKELTAVEGYNRP
jgi:hypothetical protein